MADGNGAPDLGPLQDAVTVAATARQDEFNLYNAARAAGDVNNLTVRYQAYQTALQVEQKANEVLAQNLVNSPQLVTDLQMLDQANASLNAAATTLKNDTTALNGFTQAANAVLTVLGAIAVL